MLLAAKAIRATAPVDNGKRKRILEGKDVMPALPAQIKTITIIKARRPFSVPNLKIIGIINPDARNPVDSKINKNDHKSPCPPE